MREKNNIVKTVNYITYEYENVEEKERHILSMESEDYECLDRFEHAHEATYRKFFEKLNS